MSALNPTEDEEQLVLMQWVQYQRDPRVALIFHIPNGGIRNIATAKRLKALGVRAGVPDLFLPVPNEKYHGLWIELKRRRGGAISALQLEWIEALRAQGYQVIIAKGADEAIAAVTVYLNL
jgi:hypothetical protein